MRLYLISWLIMRRVRMGGEVFERGGGMVCCG